MPRLLFAERVRKMQSGNETRGVVSFPDCIFHACRKNRSGQLPIPFSFKCAGALFFFNLTLDVIEDVSLHPCIKICQFKA